MFQKVTRPFPISIVMSTPAIPRTLNGLVYPFFSRKVQTSLVKFKANGSICIMSGPLRVLNASCTLCQAFNLYNLLIVLVIILAYSYYEGVGNKSIIMQG